MTAPVHIGHPVPLPRLSDIEFCAWIGQAAPGERLEYHRGFVGVDAAPVISKLPDTERRRLAALASAAYRAFEADLVHLVQERLATDRFAYVAVARAKPTAASVSLSELLLEDAEAA
jgi:hypothetical protein